jgi:hydrogenase maturation protease
MKYDAPIKDIIVLGIGNLLMSDEGIGVHLVQRLSDFADEFSNVDFVDAGIAGVTILHLIAGASKAIFIDCAYMDEEPGAIRRFTPREIEDNRTIANLSLHEADLLKIIEMARQLGQCPDEIVIFGVEPQVVKSGCELSKTLADRFDQYVTMIRNEIGH